MHFNLLNPSVTIQKQNKILVTGGTGFLGSYVIRQLLHSGYQSIHSVSRGYRTSALPDALQKSVQWHTGNLTDLGMLEDILSDIDVVIHLAGPHPWYAGNAAATGKQTIQGTENLVNMALDGGIKKYIHISASSAKGIRKSPETIDERNVFSHSRFDSPFGLVKFISEQAAWRAHAEGLPVTILNPTFLLGAGDWRYSSPRLWSWINRRLVFYPSGLSGWVDVRDVAEAVVRVVEGAFTGNQFILNGENISFQQICQEAADSIGIRKLHFQASHLSTMYAGLSRSLFPSRAKNHLFFNGPLSDSLQALTNYSQYDATKMLGMQFRPVHKTIQETGAQFLQFNKDKMPKNSMLE